MCVCNFSSFFCFLHGESSSPVTSVLLKFLSVSLEESSDVGDKRIVGVGVGQQGADREEDLADGQRRGPSRLLQNVKADTTVLVDVGVVDLGDELNAGRREGVLCGELNLQEKETTSIGGTFRAKNGRAPVEEIGFVFGTSRDICRRFALHVNEFLLNTLKSHFLILLLLICFLNNRNFRMFVLCVEALVSGV